jgi:hypothetical protein
MSYVPATYTDEEILARNRNVGHARSALTLNGLN